MNLHVVLMSGGIDSAAEALLTINECAHERSSRVMLIGFCPAESVAKDPAYRELITDVMSHVAHVGRSKGVEVDERMLADPIANMAMSTVDGFIAQRNLVYLSLAAAFAWRWAVVEQRLYPKAVVLHLGALLEDRVSDKNAAAIAAMSLAINVGQPVSGSVVSLLLNSGMSKADAVSYLLGSFEAELVYSMPTCYKRYHGDIVGEECQACRACYRKAAAIALASYPSGEANFTSEAIDAWRKTTVEGQRANSIMTDAMCELSHMYYLEGVSPTDEAANLSISRRRSSYLMHNLALLKEADE